MSQFPNEYHYSDTHEWVRVEGEDIVAVGISDFAQAQLGDLVFVQLPDIGEEVKAGDEIAVVESVKTASDVFSPMTGEVVEVNEALSNTPDLVNHDPYGDGWLYKIKVNDMTEFSHLMKADAYQRKVTGE